VSEPPAVVFVCARNAVRSPMAEALWRLRFGPSASVVSCGVAPAAWPDGFMIAVMEEKGADLSGFECQELEAAADLPVELVVCLAEEVDASASVFAERRGAAYQLWPMADPSQAKGAREARLEAYRTVRNAIEARVADYQLDPA
jgi:protein-tyrosine-phosphatase